jgi:NAD(P)-dependent dehydrogenase (short-subunit alcohol dehydrogenase family)
MSKLKNKIVVVTGGSGLLGKALIHHLKELGAIVINLDLILDGSETENNIHCDVTNELSVEQTINKIVQKHGKIDGWINNAYPRTSDWGNKFEEISLESWRTNVDLQLNSVFLCCQKVLKVMKIQEFGSIVNIASIYGINAPDFSIYNGTQMTMPAAYSAIKGGVINFTKYLASYFGPTGIRINSVSPGGVYSNQNELFVKQYESKVPLKRMAHPTDIAPSISFLISDEAGYITGHNLIVDGGWTII